MAHESCPACGFSLAEKEMYKPTEEDLLEIDAINKSGEAKLLLSDNGSGPFFEPNWFLNIEGFEAFTEWYNSKPRQTEMG